MRYEYETLKLNAKVCMHEYYRSGLDFYLNQAIHQTRLALMLARYGV
jgi:hypothetical protein